MNACLRVCGTQPFVRLCVYVCVCLVAQSCPTLCNHMACSLPGSSVHGILQARILEWVAIPFSSGYFPKFVETTYAFFWIFLPPIYHQHESFSMFLSSALLHA